jgi:hypothetical protein
LRRASRGLDFDGNEIKILPLNMRFPFEFLFTALLNIHSSRKLTGIDTIYRVPATYTVPILCQIEYASSAVGVECCHLFETVSKY